MRISDYIASLRKDEKVIVTARGNELDVTAERGQLTEEIIKEIRERKQEILVFFEHTNSDPDSIQTIDQQPSYELSHAQKRMWVLDQLIDETGVYNVVLTKTFQSLDTQAFRHALNLLFERHEILRTTFHMIEGAPKQVVQNSENFELELTERKVSSKELDQIMYDESLYALDLSKSATRANLIEDESGNHMLILVFHHIVIDEWSLPIFERDLKAFYNFVRFGVPTNLPTLAIQYKDYTHWQNSSLKNGQLGNSKKYWAHKLAGDLPSLNLPLDNDRSEIKNYSGAGLTFELGRGQVNKLSLVGDEVSATLFMVLTGVVNVLLHKYTDQNDIIVGSPIVGRDRPELEDQIGFYTNTVVIRSIIDSEKPFTEFVSVLKETILESYEHQFYPFDLLIEDLSVNHSQNRNPLFDVMISYQDSYKGGDSAVIDVPASNEIEASETGVNKFDLSFTFSRKSNGNMAININYNNALFNKSKMLRMVKHLQTMLMSLMSNPNQRISDIDMLSPQERDLILHDFNGTHRSDFNLDTSVKALIEGHARDHPNHTALISQDGQMSFGELHKKSNRLAHFLSDKYNINKGDRVALLMTGSFDRIVAIVAAIKLGTTYIPIDVEFSEERINYIVDDSNPSLLLADKSEESRLENMQLDYPIEYVEEVLPTLAEVSTRNLEAEVGPEDLFIILYTSGSTGKPKGVSLNNLGILNRTESVWRNYSISQNSMLYQKTNYVFDVSLSEFLLSLCYGAKLLVATGEYGRELLDNIIKHKVTHIWFSPTILNRVIDQYDLRNERIDSLKYVFSSGEELQKGTVNNYYAKFDAPLINQYGPTESSIDVTAKEVTINDRLISIGKPISNIKMYILDGNGELRPVGVPGEIGIGGIGLAEGYLNRDDLTASKFIVDPFNPDIGDRIYLTGDIGYWNELGEIEFLGRKDNQISLWGARIELGEIECAISSHSSVEESAVSVYCDDSGNSHLIGYYVENKSGESDTCAPQEVSQVGVNSQNDQKEHLHRFTPGTVDSQVVANRGLCESLDIAISKYPNSCALNCAPESLTYAELGKRITNLASVLRSDHNIQSGDLVGILLDRSIKSIVSMFAVLKTGAAYVPIDPNYPQDRISYVIENASVKLIIADSDSITTSEHNEVVQFNYDSNAKIIAGDLLPEIAHVSKPDALSYVCYTSGTSGRPKGVMVESHSVTDYVNTFIQYFQIDSKDTVIQQSSMSFDTVVEEIFPTLFSGGELVILPNGGADIDAMINAINTHKVTVLSTTPLVIDEMNQRVAEITNFPRIVISGGEELRSKQIDNLVSRVNIFNTYGPTETTVCVSFGQVVSADSPITIGRPIPNHEIIIVDELMVPVPDGKAGEILVSGSGVARGYINDVTETNKRFVKHPLGTGNCYRTGDLAKWSSEEELIYLGRNDEQVKMHGYRIETTEVSKAVENYPGVLRAYTLPVNDNSGLKHLATYFVSDRDVELKDLSESLSKTLPRYMVPGKFAQVDEFPRTVTGKIDIDRLPTINFAELDNALSIQVKNYLKNKLPNYMVPSKLVRVDSLPLTATGKIDRTALAKKNEELALNKDIIHPANIIEEQLLEIWEICLKRGDISVDDNLFAVGGNSLSAARILSLVYADMGQSLNLKDVFNNPTIQELAQFIENNRSDESLLLNLNTSSEREGSVFLIPPVFGSSTIFQSFAKQLSALGNVYGLQCRGFDKKSVFDTSIEAMAHSFVEEIAAVDTNEELTLIGYSMGVSIAFEMTKLLETRGYHVDLVFLDRGVDRSSVDNSDIDERLVKKVLQNELKLWPENLRNDNIDWLRNLLHNNLTALTQYRESGSIGSNIIAFEATGNKRNTHMTRWQDHTSGSFDHRYLEGNHYKILSPKNSSIIAKTVIELLSEDANVNL